VLFDDAGKRIGAVGGRGQGPGEFSGGITGRMYSLERGFRGDSVWTYDNNQRRFAIFAPDLTLARTFIAPQPGATQFLSLDVMSLLPGDRVLGEAVFAGPARTDGRSARGETIDTLFAVIRADGAVERHLARVPPDSLVASVESSDPRARRAFVPFRSSAVVRSSTTGDRIAFVTDVTTGPARFRVVVVRATGDTVFSRVYAFEPIAVTDRMRDSALASLDDRMRRQGSQASALRARVVQLLPATLPPFRSVRVGRDGSIWLNRNIPASSTAEFLVLSPTGDVVGVARLPGASMVVHDMTRSTVWVSELDDDGFISVVRLRVSPN
jgi:hypothetical protein